MTGGSTGQERGEGFQAWLAKTEYLLEGEFLDGDVTGMPENPYTEEGLRIAEAEALRRFASSAEIREPANREMYGKFMRYVGETFVQALGAEWTSSPMVDDGKPYIGLRYPWKPKTVNVATLVTSALARRSGDQWAFVFRMADEDRRAWLAGQGTGS
jgi:hypothetical protein